MSSTFDYAFNAVMPIMLMIGLGYTLRQLHFGDELFFLNLNRLSYRLFLPIQLFLSMLTIDSESFGYGKVLLCSLCGFILCLGIGFAVTHLLVRNRQQQGVIIQASFRSNQAIIGYPLSEALGGATAVTMASVVSAVFVPIFNILAIIILTTYSEKKNISWTKILYGIATNPLILGIASGLAVASLKQLFPLVTVSIEMHLARFTVFGSVLRDFSQIASPLMLISLGARFDLHAARELFSKVLLGCFLRLIVGPVIGIGLAVALRQPLGISPTAIAALVALFASPVAISTAVMVQEIGGDCQLANQLVVWSSVFSMITLFFLVFFLRHTGVI